MDETTEPVQPEGQGGEAASDAPYAEYLERIPEQVRADVEPVFKDWDANVTRRFQEHSEYKRSWEPFEQLGVNKLNPEDVQWGIEFRQLAENPQAVQQWYEQYAQQNGLTAEQAEELAEAVDPEISALKEQLASISQEVVPLLQWRDQQEQVRAQAEAKAEIDQQLADLKKQHGDFPVEMVEKFVANHIQSDPEHAIQLAYEDWTKFRAKIEKDYVQSKLDQPQAAEAGGTPATTPDPVSGLLEAGRIARERLKAERMG